MRPIQRKNNRSSETVPEKYMMADQLDEGFQTTALKMLKDLKEDVEKARKWCVNETEMPVRRQNT